jgi:hypothetical protein
LCGRAVAAQSEDHEIDCKTKESFPTSESVFAPEKFLHPTKVRNCCKIISLYLPGLLQTKTNYSRTRLRSEAIAITIAMIRSIAFFKNENRISMVL